MKQTPMEERIGGLIPSKLKRGMERNAVDNGRSLASELRLACEHWLRQNGRKP